jgi:hypothetical protein
MAITPASRNERQKYSPLRQLAPCENFRVPLDAQDERMGDAFNPFDDAIVGDRVDDQAFAELFNGLMVRRVDL